MFRRRRPKEHPVQKLPFELVAKGGVVGRLKVDVAIQTPERFVVSGWRTGTIHVAVSDGKNVLDPEWTFYARPDVAEHFELDRESLLGFSFQLDSGVERVVLRWGETPDSLHYQALLEFRDADRVPAAARGQQETPADRALAAQLQGDELNIQQLRESGLVDEAWYLSAYPDVREGAAGADAVSHFYFRGASEGRNPNYLFDTTWYTERYPDVAASGINPLLHYIRFGEREGRNPSIYFEPFFYREQGPVPPSTTLLGHYLKEGARTRAPNEFFDPGSYLECSPDVRDAGVIPFLHYIEQGWTEDREINASFSFRTYREALQERLGRRVEPLRYYLMLGRLNGEPLPRRNATGPSAHDEKLLTQIKASQERGPHFEAELAGVAPAASLRARLFAFYLPQFHPFAENDEWWGKGFTEWTNVTRALPRFTGHQQPRLPRDLGYYDLRNVATIRAQADLARRSGVTGFCFYYYWFNRKRLLDAPVELFLEHADIEFPFCLMWANENWTRRWDGLESEVLIAQDYRREDDEALVADFARHFADPRYERVDGRPLLFVYRPGIIPDAKARIAHWRKLFRERHGEEPLLMMAQAFGDDDPRPFGLDGAIEFPPHKLAAELPPVNSRLDTFDPAFKGHYLDYDALVSRSREVQAPPFDLIRTLVPSWDNEARKPARGMGFVGSTPEKYEGWLRYLVSWAAKHPISNKQRYVFVNAWNEWAEGAHLEPDTHHGVAYLNATLRALVNLPRSGRPSKHVLYVGHDAYLHGAQLLTLNILRTLKENFGVEVTLILLEGGPLVEAYRKLGAVHVAAEAGLPLDLFLDSVLERVPSKSAICNTVVTGEVVRQLAERGFTVTSLVHELPRLIRERSLEPRACALAEHANQVLFASDHVRSEFESVVGRLGDKARLCPQGIYQPVRREPAEARFLKDRLGLSPDARVVVNLGFGDLRKGFDLFLEVARQVIRQDPRTHFVWLGNLQPDVATWLAVDLREPPLSEHMHVLPFDEDVSLYLNGSDVLALTSREDPFPSTVLEALAVGIPVVAFAGGGGYVDVVKRDELNGSLVPMGDARAMAREVLAWLDADTESNREARSEAALREYDWKDYVFSLLQSLHPELKKVSVVVPNYNYERYLPERLGSILAQTYPVYEIIVLDDASSDGSAKVIQECLRAAKREARVVINAENSGSVFRQWRKGADLASGEFLWVAEADDSASPEFLADLMQGFSHTTTLGFTDSRQIDIDGNVLGDSYGFYYEDLPENPLGSSGRLRGDDFVRRALAIKNVILNVSAVVFRRQAFLSVISESFDDISGFRMAGDWRLYAGILRAEGTEVLYCNRPHNVHRRHGSSVTHRLAKDAHLREIMRVHEYIRRSYTLDHSQNEAIDQYQAAVEVQLAGLAGS